jgi:hypothetical protein
LAGADCHYWPEVTDALIGSLRADRNECVRLAAALALNHGCCCNRATIKALTITVSGSNEDGNPSETSERVKAAAMAALVHCLSCYVEVEPAPAAGAAAPGRELLPMPRREGEVPVGREPAGPPAQLPNVLNKAPSPLDYYHRLQTPQKQLIEEAHRATSRMTPAPVSSPAAPTDRSVLGIVRSALNAPAAPVMVEPSVSPPVERAAVPMPRGPVVPAGAATPPSAPKAPVSPVSYFTPPPPAPKAAPAAPAAASGVEAAAAAAQAVMALRDAVDPAQREHAAEALGGCDGWSNPQVVQALVEAARSDSAPLVRVACLRSLARLNVRTLPVATVAQTLKSDSDPRVRREAEEALRRLGAEGAVRPQ